MAKFLDDDITRAVEVVWCPSHCNIRGNDRADELAKEATQIAWGAPISTSRAFALRRARPPYCRLGPAIGNGRQRRVDSQFPAESHHPTKHFAELKDRREVFGRLVQCRTCHAYTGEFRRQFFPKESTSCACGENLQTREHILRLCPRYTNHRGCLQDEDRGVALPELLGIPKESPPSPLSSKTQGHSRSRGRNTHAFI
jgi:hypothetical protein